MKQKADSKDKRKPRKRRSFARRLGRRILLVLFLNVFIIGFVLLFVVIGTGTQSNIYYNSILSLNGDKLESILEDVEVTSRNILSELEEQLNHPEQIYDLLEQELHLNPNLAGCFVAFEPDYYPRHGQWFAPYLARKDSLSMERKLMGGSSYDYCQQEWYQKGIESNTGYWSDPYRDPDGAGAMLCTYALPVHDRQGRTVGVFGANLSLEKLTQILRELDVKENKKTFIESDSKVNDKDEDFMEDDLDVEDDEMTGVEQVDIAQAKQGQAAGDEEELEDGLHIFSFIIGRDGQYIVSPSNKKVFTSDSYQKDVTATPDTLDDYVCRQMVAGQQGVRKMEINGTTTYVHYAPLNRAGWSMAIAVPRFVLFFWGIVISILVLFIMLIGMAAVFIVSQVAIRRATKPLRFLTDSAEEVARGNFDTLLPQFKYHDEISQLRDSFETMQLSLKKYVSELRETTTAKASMESELRIAHEIQMSMLPKTFPAFPDRNDIDIYGSVTPAKAVGGDLYDFFIRDEKLFFCIGDVSGKGVPASLVMAVTRSLFRNVSGHTAKPDHIVDALNTALSESNETNMFVTLFVGVLDLPTGRLHYCNAGHDAPWIVQAPGTGGCAELQVKPNLPLGIMQDWTFQAQETMIVPGTTIFLYTDGLNEAEDATHRQFGLDRIKTVLETSQPHDLTTSQPHDLTTLQPHNLTTSQPHDLTTSQPQDLINAMTAAVHRFVGDTEQSDDLTLLAVQYKWKTLDVKLERRLTLHNDVQEVPLLATFVDEVCEALALDMSTTMQLTRAMEEAVVNVMNYAYPAGTRGEVRICAVANDERLKLVISDDGIPFDPTARPEADITLSAEERGIGGLGIHLVRQIMDSINYERVGEQNVFTLRKKLKG